jgi:hypothetical protein
VPGSASCTVLLPPKAIGRLHTPTSKAPALNALGSVSRETRRGRDR